MLQVYSNNVEVAANTPYPLNNIYLEKGCGVQLAGNSTIQINRHGVYLIEVDGFATPDAATLVSTQLYVNGVAQPQAESSFMGTAITATDTFGFKTYVRVAENNSKCNCYSSPTTLQIMNGDTAVSDAHINVCISQLC